MLFVNPLSPEEIKTLNEMHKNHACQASQIRAHAILMSDFGLKVMLISKIYGICRQTVSIWLHAWEDKGICGLLDKPRSGRPRILSLEAEMNALNRVNQSPRSLKKVLAELSENLGKTLSLSTLKRICKRAKLNWKRVRKSLKSKRDPDLFEKSQQQLALLIEQSEKKEIDLFYFDESGFTLEPCVPYAWQPLGKTIEIPSSKSKRLNVLGFVIGSVLLLLLSLKGASPVPLSLPVLIISSQHFTGQPH